MNEHLILTAISVTSERDRAEAEKWLHTRLNGNDFRNTWGRDHSGKEFHVDSWWIAEDVRHDGSDCGSAVFVPGDGCDPHRMTQAQASDLLALADRLRRAGVDVSAHLRSLAASLNV